MQYSELWDETTAWPEDSNGNYDATRLRDRCLQGSYLTDGASGSEDCLHVSMYSPLLVSEKFSLNWLPQHFNFLWSFAIE